MIERGPLQGRSQEWNISRKELMVLKEVMAAIRMQITIYCNITPELSVLRVHCTSEFSVL